MTLESPNFLLVVPEMFVLGMACLILIVDLFLDEERRGFSYFLAQATVIGAFALTLWLEPAGSHSTFGGSFISDPLGNFLKLPIYVLTGVVFLYSRGYLQDRGLLKGEYYVLGLFGMLGMMVIVSAHSLLTIYLGLELFSLSLYTMVAFNRDSLQASEAAMKYFVLSALASGILLYGLSLLYGLTGTLDMTQVADFARHHLGENRALVFALAFVLVGVAFKFGAAPFHMWIPDVYHGAPTPVTLYLGAAPKIAAFAMAMRLLVDTLAPLQVSWGPMLMVLAVLSLAVGNVIAIAQTNIKRMLAYSTISHMGFLLLGLLAGTAAGYSAAMFYAVIYALMSLAAFGIVILLSRAGFEAERLDDFKGLNERSPWFAFMMLLVMFSMAGVPPTAGFYAKLAVLAAVVDVHQTWLAVVAVFFSLIGAFYYLRVVKLMYFDTPVDREPISAGLDMRLVLSANGLLLLGLGLYPGLLMGWCIAALR